MTYCSTEAQKHEGSGDGHGMLHAEVLTSAQRNLNTDLPQERIQNPLMP